MDAIFLTILNMSLTGAFVIAVICLARQLLKKAPKAISYALWAVVGFRLVFPFSIESFFSLIRFNPAPIPLDIAAQAVPRIESGIPIINNTVNNAVSYVLPAAAPYYSVNPLQVWIAIGAWVWFIGAFLLMVYGVASFFVLKRKMKNATCVESNIYETDNIKSPFVLGVHSPKIYLPVGLFGQEREYILLHEQTHIRRRDHIVKFAAYFVLCLHWFNPLAWLAFWLMSADMEMSCDERVMKELGDDISKDYSMSLVRIATGRRILTGSPLAFGEGGMKERVKRILNFKKPSRVIMILSIALVAVLSVGLAVNRANADNTSVGGNPPQRVFTQRVFILEDATDEQRLTRLLSVTLNPDGTAELATPPISSYMLPETIYSFGDGELLIIAVIYLEVEEMYSLKNGDIIARFEVVDEHTLIFKESTVPMFADAGARYVIPRSFATPDEHVVFGIDRTIPDRETNDMTDAVASEQSLEVAMIIQDITPGGLSFFFENPTDSEYLYSPHYALFVKNNDSWELVEPIIDNWNWEFHDVAYSMSSNSTTNLTVIDWRWNLGELPEGHYKFQKEIMYWRSPGDFDTFIVDYEFILSARTAESSLHEAFFHIFEAVYDFDYALNHEIRYIAVDVTEVFDGIHESLLTVLQAWCDLKGYELLIDTYDGLVEAGLIVQPPDRSGFSDGLLFEFSDAEFDGETLMVRASKWRSPLGATGSEFTARFYDGNWIIATDAQGWWMS